MLSATASCASDLKTEPDPAVKVHELIANWEPLKSAA
jgi:hypothetical protein